MDAIFELQRQLAAVQTSSGLHKLSERNCVEIISKLMENGSLKLLFTSDGKEFITPDQLDREIKDELLIRGGRVNIIDLPAALNVGLESIEVKTEEIVRKDKSIRLINGQLITSYYLDSICEEVNESLQELGQIELSSLTIRFNLPMTLVREAVEGRLDTIIQGRLKESTLFTQAYVQREAAKARGLVYATTRPVQLGSLINTYKLDEALFGPSVEQMIKAGQLNAKVQAGSLVPSVFASAQDSMLESFFKQNRYIEYDRLKKLQISNPKDTISKKFKDAILLSSCAVDPSLIVQLDIAVEEAVRNQSWCECSQYIPVTLSSSDMSTLLDRCSALGRGKQAIVLGGSFVVSTALLDRCVALFQPLAQEQARADLAKRASRASTASSSSSSTSSSSSAPSKGKGAAASKGGKGGKGKGRKGNVSDSEGEEEEVVVSKGKKKEEKEKDGGADLRQSELLTSKKMVSVLTEAVDLDETLAEEVADQIRSKVLELLQQAYQSAVSSQSQSTRALVDVLESLFAALYTDLQLASKAVSVLECEPLGAFLSKGLCQDMLAVLLHHQTLANHLDLPSLLLDPSPSSSSASSSAAAAASIPFLSLGGRYIGLTSTIPSVLPLPPSTVLNSLYSAAVEPACCASQLCVVQLGVRERKKIVDNLPKEVRAHVTKLTELASKKNIVEFVAAVEAAAEECGIRVRALDKKQERPLLLSRRHQLKDLLAHESDPAAVLHLTLTALLQEHCNVCVLSPCEAWALSLLQDKLKPHLSPELHTLLSTFESLLQEVNKSRASQGDDPSPSVRTIELSKSLEALQERVKEAGITLGKVSASSASAPASE